MENIPQRSEFLAACLRDLETAAIPFCISRNHHEFWNEGLSDVDMIVPPDQSDIAVRLIKSAAAKNGYRIAASTRFDNICLVFHAPGGRFVRIDLDNAVRWRTRTLAEAREVLECRIVRDGLPVPSPAHEALILLCQFAWSGKVKPSYKDRIQILISEKSGNDGVISFLQSRFGFGAESISNLFSDGSVVSLRKAFSQGKSKRRLSNIIETISRVCIRFMRPPGILVVGMGDDGKHIREISAKLELMFPSAKSAKASDSLPKAILSLFRGGICWADKTYPLGFWVRKTHCFRCEEGRILYPPSGQLADLSNAADFIGSQLANNLSQVSDSAHNL